MAHAVFQTLWNAVQLPFDAGFWKDLRAGACELWRAFHGAACKIGKGKLPPLPRAPDSCCATFPPSVHRRPDPLIYAQYYLMAQGLAVTWDNPDIDLFDGGVPATGPLLPDHSYHVRVRVWNGSYDAPAVGLKVSLSYLSFGAQTLSHAVGSRLVNLGAKGTSDCPAFTTFEWRTPADGGHYCLQAQLEWGDDANPDNNLGQKNVDVAAVQSPAVFTFEVRNAAAVERWFAVEADAYGLPRLPPCEAAPVRPERGEPPSRLKESRARWDRALREQSYGAFPVPDDWSVTFEPQSFALGPRESRQVEARIEPRDPAVRGSRTFNAHVFASTRDEAGSGGRSLVGGVSLTAHKS